jgi:putative transposase
MRRADDEHELPVQTYAYFADRDPLTRAVMDRMLAGVSTRKFAVVGEPVGSAVEDASSATSKSTISELFIERTRTALGELMSRRLDDVRLAVMMLDGLEIADRTHVVALGPTTEGHKIPLWRSMAMTSLDILELIAGEGFAFAETIERGHFSVWAICSSCRAP